ncbi:hypothetical protein CISIN_1g032874mg [Citrus sinensis]|uniref:Uncharacterized protein n=1 Tax=Citrus sinensis TaxID=2711 RepID=A0A067GQE8_CITSI|nr:hypothetical protein CISIN_1g032874mg [Citrus sinensis]
MLEKLWDDVVAGPQPDRGLGRLRKITTTPLAVKEGGEAESSSGKFQRSLTSPHILTLPLFMTGFTVGRLGASIITEWMIRSSDVNECDGSPTHRMSCL